MAGGVSGRGHVWWGACMADTMIRSMNGQYTSY